MLEEIKQKIELLTKYLNKAAMDYYTYDNPTISDDEYDRCYAELVELEKKYPQFKVPGSPTERVGDKVLTKFEKVEHKQKMLSISDVFNTTEVEDWQKNMEKEYPDITYCAELKIDGLSVSAIYKDGVLVQASTRGNGAVGEDITNNVKMINSIPLVLNEPLNIEVRGEIYMPKASFEEVNASRFAQGLELFANPRNCASGTIKSLDPRIVKERKLDNFMYQIIDPENYGLKTQHDAVMYLKKLGFKISSEPFETKNLEELMNYIERFRTEKDTLSYPVDGMVVKVNEFNVYNDIGYTSKTPKFYIAYKYPAPMAETILNSITYQVGRTGKVTPVANFNTVNISGTDVSRATLNNEDYIIMKDIRVGDTIRVRKSGEIIPEVAEVVLEKRPVSSKPFEFIKMCPCCNQPLHKKEDMSDYFCLNENCSSRRVNSLIHFASREAMNIEGLGDRTCEMFYELGLLTDILSIFKLKEKRETLLRIEGFGEKSVNNLLQAIEDCKKRDGANVLFALGIKNVGLSTAKDLLDVFENIPALSTATYDELISIDGIGETVANSIIEYFHKNTFILGDLMDLNINLHHQIKKAESNALNGATFVITGTLSKPRKEIEDLITSHGGKISGSVSKKTNYLVCGEAAGSKLAKAQELGVKILSEQELLDLTR